MRETIRKLNDGHVLRPVEVGDIVPPCARIIVICDSQTNPEHIVPRAFGNELRVLSFEAGVLACGLGEGSDAVLQGTLGISPDEAIIAPIKRWAANEGFWRIVLVVNPKNSLGMIETDLTIIEQLDHMMRAKNEIRERVRDIEVIPILHVPDAGSFQNYRVKMDAWRVFYDRYEREELERDGEGVALQLA